jgi:LPXTG-site transpeptidase (sortase) family protein
MPAGLAPATARQVPAAAATPPAPRATPIPRPVVDEQASDPVGIRIPRIEVEAPVIPLGLDPTGALEVPADTDETGWWIGGPEPGERGPAVIAGHLDSYTGPAVFYRLTRLRPGDVVTVLRNDGSHVDYSVVRTERHPKDAFPTQAVYGPTPGSELRLITCGGAFDRSTRHYRDNVIVFATRMPAPATD